MVMWVHVDGSVQGLRLPSPPLPPHDFTIGKLSAYGLSDTSCSFLHSYTSDRKKKMLKFGQHHGSYLILLKVSRNGLY